MNMKRSELIKRCLFGLVVVGFVIFGSLPAAAQVSFSTPVIYPVGVTDPVTNPPGSVPSGVAVADLNLDGVQDFAVCNARDNTVSILLGNPAVPGAFFPAVNFLLFGTERPAAVAVADFNGDGFPDLVVANEGPTPPHQGKVSVLVGNGTGSFGFAIAIPVADPVTLHQPRSVAVADFNGDGFPDLAVASLGNVNEVSILLGQAPLGGPGGTPSFQTALTFPAGVQPIWVGTGDFNFDASLDLAVANQGGGDVSILFGDGEGEFGAPTNYPAGNLPNFGAIADLDGDGDLDLAVANAGDFVEQIPGSLSVLLNDGTGAFSTANITLPAGRLPSGVAIGLLNLDGIPDLAAVTGEFGTLEVLTGNGDGTFAGSLTFPLPTPVPAIPTAPTRVALADFNGDGRPDAVTIGTPSAAHVLLNNDAPTRELVPFTETVSLEGFGLVDLAGDLTVIYAGVIRCAEQCGGTAVVEVVASGSNLCVDGKNCKLSLNSARKVDVSSGSAVFEVTARLMVKDVGLPAKLFIGPALFTIDSFGDITDVEFSFTPVN